MGGHPARGRQTPPLPELPGRAGGGGSRVAPGLGQSSLRGLPVSAGPLCSLLSARPPLCLRPPGPPVRPGGRGGLPGAAPPPLTCSALCGAAGARRPGRRRTGCRPPPAGSRWWSPHGSAGRAAAAAAAAAPAPGGSSRRRRRSERSPAHRAPAPAGKARRTRRAAAGEAVLPAEKRGGEAPPATAAAPPPPSPPLTPSQSRGALAPPPPARLSPTRSPSPGAPRQVAVPGGAQGRGAARGLGRLPGSAGLGLRLRRLAPCPGLRRLSPLWSRGSRSESRRVNPEREGRRSGRGERGAGAGGARVLFSPEGAPEAPR